MAATSLNVGRLLKELGNGTLELRQGTDGAQQPAVTHVALNDVLTDADVFLAEKQKNNTNIHLQDNQYKNNTTQRTTKCVFFSFFLNPLTFTLKSCIPKQTLRSASAQVGRIALLNNSPFWRKLSTGNDPKSWMSVVFTCPVVGCCHAS